MKNPMNQATTGAALGFALLAISGQVICANPPVVESTLRWEFRNNANPAAPDVSTGCAGDARATVTPGKWSDGWFEISPLGSARGIWDLGNAGSISLQRTNGIVGPNSQARDFTVKVVQFHDRVAFYDVTATVSAAGAVLTGTTTTTVGGGGSLGDWVAQETHWHADAGSEVNSIVVSGATAEKKGTVIDQVSVESTFASGVGNRLNIRYVGTDNRHVEVSWSSDLAGMVLESTDDLGSAGTWTAVNQTPQLSGSTYSITLEASAARKYYRLKQP